MRKVDPSKAYRLLYPVVPALLAATRGGTTSAMPVVSLVSLSNDPPLVGVSSSPTHATYRIVERARSFSVSWLDSRYSGTIEVLGSSSGRDVPDKLLASGLHYRLEGLPPVPIVAEASAYLVCDVEEVRTYGDHEFVVGRVSDAKAVPDFNEYWEFREYLPILYAGIGRRSPVRDGRFRRP